MPLSYEADYVERLKAFLIILRDTPNGSHNCLVDRAPVRGLFSECGLILRRGTGLLSVRPNIHFRAESGLVIGQRGRVDVFVGGEVKFEDFRLVRQSICVTICFTPESAVAEGEIAGLPKMDAGCAYVVRRFHFDFDEGILNRKDRPVHHLQYGGQLRTDLIGVEPPPRYELFEQLDFPRVPIIPMDLAMVLDVFIRQFCPAWYQRAFANQGSGWPGRLARIEDSVVGPFVKTFAERFNRPTSELSFYRFSCGLPN